MELTGKAEETQVQGFVATKDLLAMISNQSLIAQTNGTYLVAKAGGKEIVGKATVVRVTSGGVVMEFTNLNDVPQSYAGQGNKMVRVKTTENGLEFVELKSDIIELGTPTDGSHSDGLLSLQSTTKVVDAIDDFNETLKDLAPDAPNLLSGSLVLTGSTLYQGNLSNDPVSHYKSGQEAGSSASYIIKDGTFALETGNTSLSFNKADQGILEAYLNGSMVDSIDLETLFNETYRDGNQVYPPRTSSNGFITMTFVGKHNLKQYQRGNAKINIQTSNLIVGHNFLQLKHIIGTEIQSSNVFDIYYDADLGSNPFITTPTITEAQLNSTKYVSGVRYYAGGDTFTLDVTGYNLFNNVYHAQPITFSGFPGIQDSSIAPNDGHATGVSNPPEVNETMTVSGKVLTINQSNQFSANARITCTPRDPYGNYTSMTSDPVNRLVNTFANRSTETVEYFSDEYYRLPNNFNFDSTTNDVISQWDSSIALTTGNALCFFANNESALVYPAINFASFLPTNVVNYSGFTGPQKYQRCILFNEGKTNCVIKLYGVSSGLNTTGNADLNLEIKLPGQTGWLDCVKNFDSGIGVSNDGDGCLAGSISYNGGVATINATFGGRTTNDSNDRLYIRLTLQNANQSVNKIEVI